MDHIKDKNKISFEDIKNVFPLKSAKRLEFYLENIFKDLTTKNGKKDLGVSKLKFIDFIKLPVFICEKIFTSMDLDKDGYLSVDELIDPLLKLYLGTFDETAEFIFNLYDFDHDGKISPEDVKMILSFLPLTTDKTTIDYLIQLESLAELDEILNKAFKGKQSLKLDDFIEVIQVESDIYLQILCFFYQKCTFKEHSVNMVNTISCKDVVKELKLPTRNDSSTSAGLSNNSGGSSKSVKDSIKPCKRDSSKIVLNAPSRQTKFSPAHDFIKKASKNIEEAEDEFEDIKAKPRKRYDSFQDLNSAEVSGYKGMKQLNPTKKKITNSKFSKNDIDNSTAEKIEPKSLLEEKNLEIILIPEEKERELLEESILFQGFLSKLSKEGGKEKIDRNYWVVLIEQDIHYYTDETKGKFVKMHNISGSFIRANGELTIKGDKFYSFSVISASKIRTFLTKDREYAKEWVKKLKEGMGYKNFFEFYEMLDNIGEGQFGLVKLGMEVATKRKVAIKIITKSKLKKDHVEMLNSEIDIMKVCKHPNIVQFIDYFENSEYIFIVMEYLQHGSLNNYLVKKKFQLENKRIAQIGQQITEALKYLHFYGIIHRDLKPDNILIADEGENFCLKIMDFGFSKILGHKERTVEGYGTLCFVAPEIIQRTPYNNSVDIWSLGVTLFYASTRKYPFDSDKNDKEIAQKICFSDIEFGKKYWTGKDMELMRLISACLEKDMKKRITIDKILDHKFLKQFEGK